MFELAGLPQVKGIHGMSLAPLIYGKTSKGREAAFSEIDHSYSQYEFLKEDAGRRVMIRTEEWKMIYFIGRDDADGALYNLAEDQGETKNLFNDSKYSAVIKKLDSMARDWDSST